MLKLLFELGRAIAQAVSCWLPTAVAQVWSCGVCGGQNGAGAGFLWVLRFPMPVFVPPIAPQSPSSLIWGWSSSGRSTKWTQSHPTKNNNNKKKYWWRFTHILQIMFCGLLCSTYVIFSCTVCWFCPYWITKFSYPRNISGNEKQHVHSWSVRTQKIFHDKIPLIHIHVICMQCNSLAHGYPLKRCSHILGYFIL
jgi:hypothetical protein